MSKAEDQLTLEAKIEAHAVYMASCAAGECAYKVATTVYNDARASFNAARVANKAAAVVYADAQGAFDDACAFHADAGFAYDDTRAKARAVYVAAYSAYIDSSAIPAAKVVPSAFNEARATYTDALVASSATYKVARKAFAEARTTFTKARATTVSARAAYKIACTTYKAAQSAYREAYGAYEKTCLVEWL